MTYRNSEGLLLSVGLHACIWVELEGLLVFVPCGSVGLTGSALYLAEWWYVAGSLLGVPECLFGMEHVCIFVVSVGGGIMLYCI